MTTKVSRNDVSRKDVAAVLIVTAAILMVPLTAMQFTAEVDWKPFDFILMGTLLTLTGLLIVIAARRITSFIARIAAITALLIALFLVWAELAVGIFGTPFAGS